MSSAQGKLEEAETMGRKALAIITKSLGKDHRNTFRVSGNLGRILMARSDQHGKVLVQAALDALLAQGLPQGHRWIVEFTEALPEA